MVLATFVQLSFYCRGRNLKDILERRKCSAFVIQWKRYPVIPGFSAVVVQFWAYQKERIICSSFVVHVSQCSSGELLRSCHTGRGIVMRNWRPASHINVYRNSGKARPQPHHWRTGIRQHLGRSSKTTWPQLGCVPLQKLKEIRLEGISAANHRIKKPRETENRSNQSSKNGITKYVRDTDQGNFMIRMTEMNLRWEFVSWKSLVRSLGEVQERKLPAKLRVQPKYKKTNSDY